MMARLFQKCYGVLHCNKNQQNLFLKNMDTACKTSCIVKEWQHMVVEPIEAHSILYYIELFQNFIHKSIYYSIF